MPILQEFVRYHRQNEKVTVIAQRMGWDRKTERKYRRRLSQAGLLDGAVDDLPSTVELRAVLQRRSDPPPQEVSSVERTASSSRARQERGSGLRRSMGSSRSMGTRAACPL
jgi:hypothetical protein